MKNTTLTFKKFKEEGKKITMLTAYDYSMAKIIDECGINSILIGDSLGMVVKGDEDTIGVTVDDIIYHTKCVKRGCQTPLIIADMPFGTSQVSPKKTYEKNLFNFIKCLMAYRRRVPI